MLRLGLLLFALVFSAGLTPYVTAEQAQNAGAARVAADKAWRSGRFDDVEKLAQAFPSDDTLAALRARAIAARGDYARAEAVLQPVAAANPGGDAALETGLLQLMVGRRTEGRRTLQLVMM